MEFELMDTKLKLFCIKNIVLTNTEKYSQHKKFCKKKINIEKTVFCFDFVASSGEKY